MIVNEEGKIKKLPYNEGASDILDNWDDIVGDVLIMQKGFVNGEPDIVGLSDEQVQAVIDILENDYNVEFIRTCRVCGCTDYNACLGGCYWVEDDLCSECVEVDEEDMVEED